MTDKRPIAVHTITQYDASSVLYVLRLDGGVSPGSFTERLIETTLIADTGNKERLERGFEGLVSAVRVYKEVPEGTKILQAIAAGESWSIDG